MKPNNYKSSDFLFGRNLMAVIALFCSMIYVCAVDSMDTLDLIIYALPCVLFWYITDLLNTRYNEVLEEEQKENE